MGTAGTGKTYLIKAIRCRLQEMVGRGSKSPMIVLALTGVAAFNIDGITIHSGLSISIINDSKRLDINGERLKQLQDKLSDVRYVIIDEKSMIGRRMLAIIDMRLQQAFPEHNNEPFGGRSVILFGDFGQLPPVLDLPMYADDKRDALSNSGLAVYKQFKEAYKLKTVQRQSGNSKEQQEFRGILSRMRIGESSREDWIILTTRIKDKLSVKERNEFSNALFILTKWSEVNAVNIDRLRSLNAPVAKIQAMHTGGNEAKKANSDTAHGLEAYILLARGARVMLMANLQTDIGLVNGSMGTVQDIIFNEDQGPPCLPIAVLISFDNYKGPTITSLKGERVVPIAPI
ncbi:ATP-dependent DNA helicase Pif1-like [Rhizophagus clarus]|uniref:ATP-dependent DNA helicase n=1 Tax=Rhizophagus clarus TaxID=94130 RepID=A0A8H3L8E1_9GLOM|nr:ATP-dependent DNA helicase Pif1-like [Rhizophagus clarus]